MQIVKYLLITVLAVLALAGVSSASLLGHSQDSRSVLGAGQFGHDTDHSWQQVDQDASKITVYVTKTGTKYHCSGCQYLRKSKIAISLQSAVDQGYDPCSVCGPPVIEVGDGQNKQQPGDADITVYITKTGEKYHRSGCRYLKKSKIAITLKDAKERGYDPCSVCDPPV
jgi:hypothetical protein